MSTDDVKTDKSQRSLTRLGRLCCEGAVGLFEARKSALRSLGRAENLVRSLRHVPPEDVQAVSDLLDSLTAFGEAARRDEAREAEPAGPEITVSAAVATTFSAPARRRIRECLGPWFSVKVGRSTCIVRDGVLRVRRAQLPARGGSVMHRETVRELRSLLEGTSALTEKTRQAEQGLDLAAFGLMPCDCARFGLKEQIRYHRLMGSVSELGGLLSRRLG
ncbi:MAG: hypothetical protein Q4F72_05775 [Desulfovibrionaceae bacterium]|nr:hypothetical protein [Desulfovibrionaceae bacterium]